jgi:tRNA A58 N-methylase Trm61
MPQNTRVWRCVEKLKKKYKYKGAIAICQSTTEQSYKTGKQTRKKQTRKKQTRKRQRRKKQTRKKQTRKRQRRKNQKAKKK